MALEVKARIDAKPSDAAWQLIEYQAEVLQNRYERWTRYWYGQILAGTRQSIEELGHIPDDAELQAILTRYDVQQERVLQRLFLNLYGPARELVLTPEQSKAVDHRLQVKARHVDEQELTVQQQRLLAWIRVNLELSMDSINRTTMQAIEELRRTCSTNTEFFRALQTSGTFDAVRARTIAVTQTNQAINSALSEAADEAADGRPMVKTWRTSGRTNVRDTHRRMAGVTIPADELYQVPRRHGGYDLMDHPSDSSHGASAENIINCHCKSFKRLAEYE